MSGILFKGFHLCDDGPDVAFIDGVEEKGKWAFGYYVCATDKHGLRQHLILVPDFDFGYFDHVDIDPFTVCRYTGLTDKNGRKIFQGDRVRVPMYRPERAELRMMEGTITWRNAAFHVVWDEEIYGKHFAGYLEGIEVIGSVFDVPDEEEGEVLNV